MRRNFITAFVLAFITSMAVVTTGAEAIVVDMNPSAVGQTSVTYPADQSSYYGLALSSTTDSLGSAGIPYVATSAPCVDPALSADLVLPGTGLCSHGGSVLHANETFALTWDPDRTYWSTTRNYLETFLSDVAAGSGGLTSPYADTGQYTDSTGRAANQSVYGGGCIDYGATGGASCQFDNDSGSGAGNDYPTSGCSIVGTNQWYESPGGIYDIPHATDTCLTDAQIQSELWSTITSEGLLGRTKPGYTPLVVMLTPPNVVVCLDSAGKVCSANVAPGSGTTQFCSYHSQVNVNGTNVAYVVQPWTAAWTEPSGCDDPTIPTIPAQTTVQQLATDVGIRLVSPLSQAEIAAIVNPGLNGWFNNTTGDEINDDGCVGFGENLDSVTVGTSSQNPYLLQREFNNAGVIESDPNALECLPLVNLEPQFVVPSAVDQGDTVELDGSTTVSSLIVPKANYAWNFGDGTTGVGPSVVHTYTTGGTYNVTLTVTDRGGNVATLTQTIQVLGAAGQTVTPPPAQASSGGGGVSAAGTALSVRLQMLPQSLKAVLRSGISIRVSSNQPASGIASVSITRAAAKRAHIKVGRGPTVVIGLGTVSSITAGTVNLHLHLSAKTAAKLRHLGRVTLTVRLALVAAGGQHYAIDAAGKY
jgi:hypothetical protein